MKIKKSKITNDNFDNKFIWINIKTKASFDLSCFVCGSEEYIYIYALY